MRNKLYAERDIEGLDKVGSFYFKHVLAMTAENLQSKSAIAAELGYRDSVIVELQARLEHAIAFRNTLKQQNAEMLLEIESLKSSLKRSYAANDHLNDQHKDLAVMKHARFNDDECWIFDEDNLEENHLESLVCPVVIRARKLREILTKNAELAAQVEAYRSTLEYFVSNEFEWNDPHDSMIGDIHNLLELPTAQCLLEVRAVAGRDGYQLGAERWCSHQNVLQIHIEHAADQYANKIREGE